MWVWHKGKISVSTLPRTTVGAHTHSSHESNALSSQATRRNLFLILFLLLTHCHCWVSLPSNKIWAGIFPIFCQGEAPPLTVPGGMIERSLHSSPRLRAKIVFSENYQEGVCVRLWERVRGRPLECWCKTFGDEWAEQQLHRPGDRSCKGGGYVARSISRHLPRRTLNVTLSDCSIVILQ